jgi:hypothetical protein
MSLCMENVYIVGRENFEDEVKVGGRADMQRASTIWIRMRLRRLFMKWWILRARSNYNTR